MPLILHIIDLAVELSQRKNNNRDILKLFKRHQKHFCQSNSNITEALQGVNILKI